MLILNIVEVENLTKKFKKTTALNEVTLSIKKGEVFGLLGPNGAGKTTLIRILLGLLKPTSGLARVFDHEVTEEIMEIRKRASLLPQEASVYDVLTARENIQYYGEIYGNMPKEAVKARTDKLIKMIGLERRADDATKEFSGGMKRKVLVARALVMDPDLIFLDEPTTGIDILGARVVRNLIKKLSREHSKTIVLTTHDLTEIEDLCDRVGIMVKGKLVAVGPPGELEQQFKKAHIEDVFIGLTTGEGVEEMEIAPKKHRVTAMISKILRRG